MPSDYEAVATEFMRLRSPHLGVAEVQSWAERLPGQAEVLDIGCGHGLPLTRLLAEHGFSLYAVEASATLAEALRVNVPSARLRCETVESSDLFGRQFDGVLAWGLLFLLTAQDQQALLAKLAAALVAGGSLLFTAPRLACAWRDQPSGHPSCSLGAVRYRELLANNGLLSEREYQDSGGNYYYECRKA